MTGSLAYRKNASAIQRGDVPEKYTRILPFIPGNRIVEAGSAEGVLACLLARDGRDVTAIEANVDRHRDAIALANRWAVGGTFVNGRIEDNLFRLEGADTFVAVRAIYYWGDYLDTVFAALAEHVPAVVLCGNANRARAWRNGTPHEPLGETNRYAASEGMRDVLERHGYTVTSELLDGDEIVVGTT